MGKQEPRTALLLTTSNPLPQQVEFRGDREGLDYYYKLIGCSCIEIVRPRGLSEEYCMIVDEEALLKADPVINPTASLLYGVMQHGTPICGNVLIAKNEHTIDGIETVGLTRHDVGKILKQIRKAYQTLI